MPQCAVHLYDDTLASLNNTLTIEVTETDHFGGTLDNRQAITLGPGEFGAKINLPNPPKAIKVWVDDPTQQLAPAALGHLNGKMISRLDVILYPAPTPTGGRGGGGRGGGAYWQIQPDVYSSARGSVIGQPFDLESDQNLVQTPVAIAGYINYQVDEGNWSELEAMGVRSLVETVTLALNTPDLDMEMRSRFERWQALLNSLGISIAAQIAKSRESEGGQSQGGLMEASS